MKMYHDFYGNLATIRVAKSGAARLTIRRRTGGLIHAKDYKTERGARTAMGRMSDGWCPVPASKGVDQCPAHA